MSAGVLAFVGLLLAAPDAGPLVSPDAATGAVMAPADGSPAAPPPGPPPPKGPPPAARMTCAPSPVRVGEPLVCTIDVLHRKEVTVALTAPAGAEPEPAGPAIDAPGGQLQSVRRFSIRPLGLRDVRVAGVRLVWTESTGGQATLDVPPQRIKVKSMLQGEADPRFRTFAEPQVDADAFWAAHGPLPYRKTNWPAVIAALVILGVGVGVGVGVLVKRWLDARRPRIEVLVDPRPAHVIALEALDRLERDDLPGQGEVMRYYVRLSEVVRAYLERRFGFSALEMTSDEIRSRVAQLALADPARLGIDDFLDETDLVKFADFNPGEAALDTMMKLARGLIGLTRVPDEVMVTVPKAAEVAS